MRVKLLLVLPGALLVVVGIALSAQFTFVGPTFPDDPLGFVGWGLLLVGLAEMKLVDAIVD
jgi:hypothetical protein